MLLQRNIIILAKNLRTVNNIHNFNMIRTIKWIISSLFHACNHSQTSFSECGNLTIRNKILTAGTTVEIQFIPSKEWLFPSIVQRGLYRWIYRNNTKLYLLFKNTTNEYDNRLSEDNFTLKIKNVQSRDEGEYKVECRTDKAIATTIMYFNTKYVDLKLQEPFSTSTSTVTATKQVESSAQGIYIIEI